MRQVGGPAKFSRQTGVTVDFMGFPREVRDMVYELALCVDGVLAPCVEHYTIDNDYKGPPPTVALLATNKRVRDETLPVLFGKNNWRITSEPKYLTFRFECDGETDSYYERYVRPRSTRELITTLFGRFRSLLRRVTLDFNFQEIDRTELVNRVHTLQGFNSADERMRVLHNESIGRLVNRWLGKQYFFIWTYNVTSFVLDVTNTYCPFGCCRIEVLERLFGGDSFFTDGMVEDTLEKGLKIPSFEFRGIRSDEEEELAERWQQGLKERALSQRLLYEARLGRRTSPKSEKWRSGESAAT